MYLKHHIDEPNRIYLWVLGKNNIPMSYQLTYSRKKHEALEGVKGKVEEGAFMVLGEDPERIGDDLDEKGKEQSGGGYTIGGDVSFYEWDFTENMPQKNSQQ